MEPRVHVLPATTALIRERYDVFPTFLLDKRHFTKAVHPVQWLALVNVETRALELLWAAAGSKGCMLRFERAADCARLTLPRAVSEWLLGKQPPLELEQDASARLLALARVTEPAAEPAAKPAAAPAIQLAPEPPAAGPPAGPLAQPPTDPKRKWDCPICAVGKAAYLSLACRHVGPCRWCLPDATGPQALTVYPACKRCGACTKGKLVRMHT